MGFSEICFNSGNDDSFFLNQQLNVSYWMLVPITVKGTIHIYGDSLPWRSFQRERLKEDK